MRVLCCGMRRSGSTLLCNLVREIVKFTGDSLYTKYIKDIDDYDPAHNCDYEVL